MNYRTLIFFFIACFHQLQAQEIKVLHQGSNASLRGLSVVSNEVVWASGSNGTIIRTTDGGKTFQVMKPKGYEKRDFRDIEAFDRSTAIIIAIDTPAVILKTTDGGQTWRKVFEDRRAGMFLDAMDFNGTSGVVVGDPINGQMFRAYTHDQGESWIIDQNAPQLTEGEAFFASSGSNVHLIASQDLAMRKVGKNEHKGIFVSGGMQSRMFSGNLAADIPIQKGKSTTGANGFAIDPEAKYGFICGGDFSDPKRSDSSMLLFELKKNKIVFSFPASSPSGYKSAVAFAGNNTLLACGTSGVDISKDNGKNWKKISDLSFHVCNAIYDSGKVWLAGPKAGIAMITLNQQ
jgi:photosystem II stability/assembly factor-like uncharacterized protein